MTYTTISTERDVSSKHHVYVTIDITSLGAAGVEAFDPSNFGINRVTSVSVDSVENPANDVVWDEDDAELSVTDDTGSAVAQSTDVGRVQLHIVGV